MTILGIDPGYAIAGWGIIIKKGSKLEMVDYGCITTDKDPDHARRLKILSDELNIIIKKYKPEVLSIEQLFFFKNLKTAIKVAESRGVALATAINHNLEIQEFTPLQIKQAITSYGRADKKQMQQMVKFILNLSEAPKPDDAADALAVAITAAHTRIIK